MAIQVGGTTVIDNNKQLANIASVDATTKAMFASSLSTTFATAAQGALADSAVQPTDTQTQAAWEAGTSTTESLVSPAKVSAAIAALAGGGGSATRTLLTSGNIAGGQKTFDLTGSTYDQYDRFEVVVNNVQHTSTGVWGTNVNWYIKENIFYGMLLGHDYIACLFISNAAAGSTWYRSTSVFTVAGSPTNPTPDQIIVSYSGEKDTVATSGSTFNALAPLSTTSVSAFQRTVGSYGRPRYIQLQSSNGDWAGGTYEIWGIIG